MPNRNTAKKDKIKVPESLKSCVSMREESDKKGGGLMLLWKKDKKN